MKVIRDYVQILLTHHQILTDLRAQIVQWGELSPVFSLLLTIPGVGELTAATVLGEVGDISRFASVKQLIAFAGLDPAVYQSGKFTATRNKISKRGSTYLRKYLYMAAAAGIRKPKGIPTNPVLYEYYSRKLEEGKPQKVAIVATCNKLLRIIYGVWSNAEPFRA
jgi:transposase